MKDPITKMKIRTKKKEMTETTKKMLEKREKRKQDRLYKMKQQGINLIER